MPSKQISLNALAAGTIVTAWAPGTGKRLQLAGMSLSVSAACSLLFENNAAGAGNFVFRTPKLLVDTPYTFFFTDMGGALLLPVNNVLKLTSSAAANVTGTLFGTEI